MENKDLLKDFVKQGFDYIGIGGVAGEGSPIRLQHMFYGFIFHTLRADVKTHGLGITSEKLLTAYPWYSVDSTSWLSFARYGNSKIKDKRVVQFKAKTA
ncbi:MAG: hypothetical protein WC733_09940, partial [Methylophilus sp.]